MTVPNLASDAVEDLGPAFEGTLEGALIAAIMRPLQKAADVLLDDRGAWRGVFAGDVPSLDAVAWGAQFSGVDARLVADRAVLRSSAERRVRWWRGTPESIIAAVRGALSGSRDVILRVRYDAETPAEDVMWHLQVIVRTDEAPAGGVDEIRRVVMRANVLPARFILHIAVADSWTWTDLATEYEDWDEVKDSFADWVSVRENNPST